MSLRSALTFLGIMPWRFKLRVGRTFDTVTCPYMTGFAVGERLKRRRGKTDLGHSEGIIWRCGVIGGKMETLAA